MITFSAIANFVSRIEDSSVVALMQQYVMEKENGLLTVLEY